MASTIQISATKIDRGSNPGIGMRPKMHITPGGLENAVVLNISPKSALVCGSGRSLLPIRYVRTAQATQPSNAASVLKANASLPPWRGLESVGKLLRGAAAKMVRVDDLGTKLLGAAGSFARCHGVRKIHADERNVDVLERFHLRGAFGVSGKIEELAAQVQNVAIAAPLVMKELARSRAAREVVHGDGFDFDSGDAFLLAGRDGL